MDHQMPCAQTCYGPVNHSCVSCVCAAEQVTAAILTAGPAHLQALSSQK